MDNKFTDEQLLRCYQKGDSDAFAKLYGRYKNAIYHYFSHQVHITGAAEELHQDVWLRVIKSATGFNQQASFKTWLYTIAHNRLIDYYRTANKQPLHLINNAFSDNDGKTDTQNEISISSQPDVILQQQQLNSALLSAIKSLPEEQREVFLLHEKSSLTLQEIAVITDNSFEGSKSRLRYAVKKLRHSMSQYLELK